MSMIALGPDAATAAKLACEGGVDPAELHLTLVHVPTEDESATPAHLSRLEELGRRVASSLPPATGVISGGTTFGEGAQVAVVSIPGLGARRAEIAAVAKRQGVPISEDYDFVPHVTRSYGPEPAQVDGAASFDHIIVGRGTDPATWVRLPLRGVTKLGPFTPDLHPHGWHGHWDVTGGVNKPLSRARSALRPTVEIGGKGNRSRARAGSGRAYRRGPAALNPIPAHMKPTLFGVLKPGGAVHIRVGSGAASHVHVGRVISHNFADGVHHATIRAAGRIHQVHVRKLPLHPQRGRSVVPRPSGFVDHQAVEQWWAGRIGARRSSPLPRAPIQPGRSSLGRPAVRKDAMTVTEDLGHDGQSPVTIMQGGSRLERCPRCGYKLSSDGQCPRHGNVIKSALRTGGAVIRKEDGPVASTGEALPGGTVDLSGAKRSARPKQNYPDGAPTCPDCGGTDGYHAPDCPRNVLNPGGAPTGLGAS